MKTHFTSNIFFSRKLCRLRDNYKQSDEIREATELFDDEAQYYITLMLFSSWLIKGFFFVALRPIAGHGLLFHDVSRSHITTHNSR